MTHMKVHPAKGVEFLRVEWKVLKVHWIRIYRFTQFQRPRVAISLGAINVQRFFGPYSTSSQNFQELRGRSSLDRWHWKFPHWLSLLRDVGVNAIAIEKTQPVEEGRDVQL